MEFANIEEAIEHAKAKYPGRAAILDDDQENPIVVFRAPTRAEWDQMIEGGGDQAAIRKCAKDCLVFPDPIAFSEILDRMPQVLRADILPLLSRLAGKGKVKTRMI